MDVRAVLSDGIEVLITPSDHTKFVGKSLNHSVRIESLLSYDELERIAAGEREILRRWRECIGGKGLRVVI